VKPFQTHPELTLLRLFTTWEPFHFPSTSHDLSIGCDDLSMRAFLDCDGTTPAMTIATPHYSPDD